MLTEKRVLSSVKMLLLLNTIDAEWLNLVIRDEGTDAEVTISRTPHCKAYSHDMKNEFLAEVETAGKYIDIMGW